MADLYGYDFSPDLANRFRQSLNSPTGTSQLPSQVGQALQVLSLHLPAFTGGAPIAPDALLRPRLGGFSPDAAVRLQTTGSGAPPSLPSQGVAAPTPTPASPPLGVFSPSAQGSSSPFSTSSDAGPSGGVSSAPPSPNISFENGNRTAAPTPGSGDAPIGGGTMAPTSPTAGNGSPLSDLLDRFLSGSVRGRA